MGLSHRTIFLRPATGMDRMPRHIETQLTTPDGVCTTHLFEPDGRDPRPAVIMYMDGIGMRPALWEVAERIARQGYYVALPDLFYRVGYKAEYGVTVFQDAEKRADLMTRIMPSASAANVMRDTDALLALLDGQKAART